MTLPQCNAAWHVVYLRLIQYIVWSLFHCTNIPRRLKALDKKPQIFCCWFYLLCGAIYCTWKKLAANCLVMVPQGTGSLTFSTLKVKAWLWCHCARVPKCLVCLRKKVTMPQGTCSCINVVHPRWMLQSVWCWCHCARVDILCTWGTSHLLLGNWIGRWKVYFMQKPQIAWIWCHKFFRSTFHSTVLHCTCVL